MHARGVCILVGEGGPEPAPPVVFRLGDTYWRILHSEPEARVEFLNEAGRWEPSRSPPLVSAESGEVAIVSPEQAGELGLPD